MSFRSPVTDKGEYMTSPHPYKYMSPKSQRRDSPDLDASWDTVFEDHDNNASNVFQADAEDHTVQVVANIQAKYERLRQQQQSSSSSSFSSRRREQLSEAALEDRHDDLYFKSLGKHVLTYMKDQEMRKLQKTFSAWRLKSQGTALLHSLETVEVMRSFRLWKQCVVALKEEYPVTIRTLLNDSNFVPPPKHHQSNPKKGKFAFRSVAGLVRGGAGSPAASATHKRLSLGERSVRSVKMRYTQKFFSTLMKQELTMQQDCDRELAEQHYKRQKLVKVWAPWLKRARLSLTASKLYDSWTTRLLRKTMKQWEKKTIDSLTTKREEGVALARDQQPSARRYTPQSLQAFSSKVKTRKLADQWLVWRSVFEFETTRLAPLSDSSEEEQAAAAGGGFGLKRFLSSSVSTPSKKQQRRRSNRHRSNRRRSGKPGAPVAATMETLPTEPVHLHPVSPFRKYNGKGHWHSDTESEEEDEVVVSGSAVTAATASTVQPVKRSIYDDIVDSSDDAIEEEEEDVTAVAKADEVAQRQAIAGFGRFLSKKPEPSAPIVAAADFELDSDGDSDASCDSADLDAVMRELNEMRFKEHRLKVAQVLAAREEQIEEPQQGQLRRKFASRKRTGSEDSFTAENAGNMGDFDQVDGPNPFESDSDHNGEIQHVDLTPVFYADPSPASRQRKRSSLSFRTPHVHSDDSDSVF